SSKRSASSRPDGLSAKPNTLFRYQYRNHLRSACLEADGRAEIISYEEYHPFGTSAHSAIASAVEAPPKRYRYTGMERDEESGLNCHGARYYASWLARWMSADPAFLSDGMNIYEYSKSNPVQYTDQNGRQADPFVDEGMQSIVRAVHDARADL